MFSVYKSRAISDWDAKYRAEGIPRTDPQEYTKQPFVQTILRHLPPGSRVLDAGCGTGGLVWFLRQRGNTLAGIDTSPSAIAIARQIAPAADLRIGSLEEIPFPAAHFDAYLAIGSWEYPPTGPAAAAREAARVLKPGGFVFVEVPHANVSRRLFYLPLKRLQQWVGSLRHGVKAVRFSHHLFRIREMHNLLRLAGFEIIENNPHDLPEPSRHYGLWVDWPFFRGGPHYELNALGRMKKRVANTFSPWTIATGMFIVARKK